MADNLNFTIALVPIAPFIAALLAPLVFKFSGAYSGWILAIIPAGIFIFLAGFVPDVAAHHDILTNLEWIPAAAWVGGPEPIYLPSIGFSFFIDGLSLTFGLLISGIGTIIIAYSGAYMKGHPHQGRFFAFMLMFMGSMLGLVLADNMIVFFIFWELTTITSFLLIGFDHGRQAARRAAIQALIVTNAGGLALLAGIVMLYGLTINEATGAGTWSLADIRGGHGFVRESVLYLPVLALFLGGAFTKSAQFPFHFWLPNAMEAPTPVSAFLHSATMVKAGVYLLARMSPTLGGTYEWSGILVVVGGVTLLYGAINALNQTDLKQMLAQTTIASLGLLVLLLGVNTEAAISAAVLYLIAHALYKAGLFLASGVIDHGTGTRQIGDIGGLSAKMPLTFIAVGLAAFSMAGLPPAIGFLAKEEMYAGLLTWDVQNLLVLVVLVAGNALMMAAGLLIAMRPFLGPLKPTPYAPHEGSFSLVSGPLLLGLLAIAAGLSGAWLGANVLKPTASTIYGFEVDSHVGIDLATFISPIILVSIATWAAGIAIFLRYDAIRNWLHRLERWVGWNFDIGFDWLMFGLIRSATYLTRRLHHGRLELYLLVIFLALAAAIFVPLVSTNSLPPMPEWPKMNFYEWSIMLVAALGVVIVVVAQTRLTAIVSLGIQGFAVAVIFMLFGAPDLSFTQFMVETLSVVILALVMTRLELDRRDARDFEHLMRDGAVAIACGAGITTFLLVILTEPLDLRLTEFFAATSVAVAHGHNIVNVILVDYRGLDTLGEISVVMTAGIAILALIRIRAGGPQGGAGAPKKARPVRKPRAAPRGASA